MSGLSHTFYLLSVEKHAHPGRIYAPQSPLGTVELHDDRLRYLYDTLQWIPSHNPSRKMVEQMGLNLHGQTVIKKSGATIARKILRASRDLFQCGPEVLELTGNYILDPEKAGEGHFETLVLGKSYAVRTIEELAAYCDQLIESDDAKFILLCGI